MKIIFTDDELKEMSDDTLLEIKEIAEKAKPFKPDGSEEPDAERAALNGYLMELSHRILPDLITNLIACRRTVDKLRLYEILDGQANAK